MIVADTGAILALLDADDAHHTVMRDLYRQDPNWILPWAILPEVDFLARRMLGDQAARAFLEDVRDGAFDVEWEGNADLARAVELHTRYAVLHLGLVDAVVMATAERLGATAIATLDVRDFGAVRLRGVSRLFPRDLS